MIRLTRKLIWTCLLALSLSWAMQVSATEKKHSAQELVEKSVSELLGIMRNDGKRIRSDPEFMREKLDEIVVPQIDFVLMTKSIVAKHWRRATDEQKDELVTQFKQFLLNTYASAINEYKDGEVKFEPFKPESREDRAVVRSVFKQSGSNDISLVYKLRRKKGWKIYEIEVDQLNLIAQYRSSFAREVEKTGIEGLINTLKTKNGEK